MEQTPPAKTWLVALPALILASGLVWFPILRALGWSRPDAWLVTSFTLASIGHSAVTGSRAYPRGGIWDIASIASVCLVIAIVGLGFAAAPVVGWPLVPLALVAWLAHRLRPRLAEMRRRFEATPDQRKG
jgi:hypothetical protein